MNIINRIKSISVNTAERHSNFEADLHARYDFAKKFCKGKDVLDIGTGIGLGANYLAKNGANSVLGIDYSKTAIDEAIKKKEANATFKILNVLDLQKLNKKFDVITAFEIIEHISPKEIQDVLANIARLLRKNGVYLVTTPNKLKMTYFLGKSLNPYHLKEYTAEEIKALLSKYFNRVIIKGLECTNDKYNRTLLEIKKSTRQKIAYFIGYSKSVRMILAYFPISLKRGLTKENNLPFLTPKDFRLSNNPERADGFFAIASKV